MRNFIESSREKIKEALENNRLSIFVGSGVSLNSGFPSWDDIIFKFASDMGLIESFKEDKSTENYLKISEQYYIERGKKEYIETVKALFPNNYDLNEIHECLAKIKPQNYITTNYDNLLEEMADCNFQNYNLIKSNEDLPYSTTNSSIIKLYGDFEKNNFVLKESDFLSFSNTFKLVENKVKELLSSNLILFIGYSVSDPNFKLIMQMVKDTLHEDFQNTYLLDIKQTYSKREFDYYKNRGINVLHYDEIKGLINEEFKTKKFNIIHHEDGKKLYFFLRYLFDENKKNKREKIKEEIILLDKIEYIGVETLKKIFKKYNIQIDNDNEISIYNEKNKEDVNNLEFLKSKKEFLRKNNIKDEKGLDRQNIELFQYSFKTYEAYKTDKNFMKKMYYFYYFEKDNKKEPFIKELSKHSLKSFKEKDYIKHFIINLNIKKITGDDDLGRDLDLILSEMPKSYSIIKEILNDFKDLKIFYKLNFEISKVSKNIDEMKNNFENGGFSFNSYFQKVNSQMEDLFYIIHRNFLLVDLSLLKNMVINFFEVMLNYSSINPNINRINYFKKSINNVVKDRFEISLSKFDFILMYHYLNYKDICELKEKYDWSNTKINKDSKVDITNFFIEEINFLFQKGKKEKIKTILMILTLLDISSNEIVEVIKKFKLKGQSNEFYKFVNRFILHYINKIETSKEFENIVDVLLIELLDKDPFSNYKIGMLNNLFYIFRFQKEKIKKWMKIILIGNYSKEDKENIILFFSKHKDLKVFLEENQIKDLLFDGTLQLKHDLIINNVLEDNNKIFLDILKSKNIRYVESLYVNNKILPEIIKKYNLKEKSVLIKLLENPELFSIEKAKEVNNNYIFMGNSMVHKNIKKNENFKKYAIDLIKEKLNTDINNDIKKNLMNILCDNYL